MAISLIWFATLVAVCGQGPRSLRTVCLMKQGTAGLERHRLLPVANQGESPRVLWLKHGGRYERRLCGKKKSRHENHQGQQAYQPAQQAGYKSAALPLPCG